MMREKTLTNVVFGSLLAITVLSVGAGRLGLTRGPAVGVALGLAAIKAGLIGWVFMRLRHEGWLIRGIVLVGVVAVLILTLGIAPDVALRLGP